MAENKGQHSFRLAILTEFFYPDLSGGTGIAVTNLAEELSGNSDIAVSVFCSANPYRGTEKLPKTGAFKAIEIFRSKCPDWNRKKLPLRVIGNICLSFSIARKIIFSPKFDALIVTTAPPFLPLAAVLTRWFRGTPFFYVVYDLEPNRSIALNVIEKNHPIAKMIGAMQKLFTKSAKAILPIGRCMAELIVKDFKIKADKIQFVPVGGKANITALPDSSSTPTDQFVVLYSGNLGRYHDFDTILACADKFRNNPRIQFKIAGDGAKRKEIEEKVKSKNLSNVVVMDPVHQNEYSSLLASADVCLITMENGIEGTCVPSKLYTIMGAGKPIIAISSPNAELSLTLNESKCGIQVAPEDVDGLFDAITTFASDYVLVRKMGSEGRKTFEKKYSMTKVGQEFLEVLKNFAGYEHRPVHLAPIVLQAQLNDDSERIKGEA